MGAPEKPCCSVLRTAHKSSLKGSFLSSQGGILWSLPTHSSTHQKPPGPTTWSYLPLYTRLQGHLWRAVPMGYQKHTPSPISKSLATLPRECCPSALPSGASPVPAAPPPRTRAPRPCGFPQQPSQGGSGGEREVLQAPCWCLIKGSDENGKRQGKPARGFATRGQCPGTAPSSRTPGGAC